MTTIETRLATLERSNRRLRLALGAGAAVVLGAALLGFYAPPQTPAERAIQENRISKVLDRAAAAAGVVADGDRDPALESFMMQMVPMYESMEKTDAEACRGRSPVVCSFPAGNCIFVISAKGDGRFVFADGTISEPLQSKWAVPSRGTNGSPFRVRDHNFVTGTMFNNAYADWVDDHPDPKRTPSPKAP